MVASLSLLRRSRPPLAPSRASSCRRSSSSSAPAKSRPHSQCLHVLTCKTQGLRAQDSKLLEPRPRIHACSMRAVAYSSPRCDASHTPYSPLTSHARLLPPIHASCIHASSTLVFTYKDMSVARAWSASTHTHMLSLSLSPSLSRTHTHTHAWGWHRRYGALGPRTRRAPSHTCRAPSRTGGHTLGLIVRIVLRDTVS